MLPPPNDNRRAYRRASLIQKTRIRHDGEAYSGRILNISVGGAGLQMEVRLPDATEITVEIEDIGMIPARIVRQMDDGVGVEFTFSPEKEQMFIRQIARIIAEKRREKFYVVS
ncbi:MAG: PilZ domain-containing protein [Sneathiella sp.]